MSCSDSTSFVHPRRGGTRRDECGRRRSPPRVRGCTLGCYSVLPTMQSRYDAHAAARLVESLSPLTPEPLALRTYTARLIGREASLVLHGGGNTSVKTTATTLFGDSIDVLHVKGSGWD